MIDKFLQGYITESDEVFSFDKLINYINILVNEIRNTKLSRNLLYLFKYYYIVVVYYLILNKLINLIKKVNYYEQ